MNKVIYLLKFKDLELNGHVFLKKYKRIDAARRAARTMKNDKNIELIKLSEYNCNTLTEKVIENYGIRF